MLILATTHFKDYSNFQTPTNNPETYPNLLQTTMAYSLATSVNSKTLPCPIEDTVLRPGVNVFTMASLNHGYSGYIGSGEREEMAAQKIAMLRESPEYSQGTMLSYYLSTLTRDLNWSFDFALDKLGINAATACPWMEKLLFDQNLAVIYVECDSDGLPIDDCGEPKFGFQVRKLDEAEQAKWRPAEWVVLNNEVADGVIEEMVEENEQRLQARREHSKQVKAHKASMRKRLSAELSELREISERAEAAVSVESATPDADSEQLRTESDRFMKKSEELDATGPIFI